MGVGRLRLGYQGSVGYLEPEQRQAVITWLQTKDYWNLAELQGHLQDELDVVFDSKQSYYTLFEQAGISAEIDTEAQPERGPSTGSKKNRRLQTG